MAVLCSEPGRPHAHDERPPFALEGPPQPIDVALPHQRVASVLIPPRLLPHSHERALESTIARVPPVARRGGRVAPCGTPVPPRADGPASSPALGAVRTKTHASLRAAAVRHRGAKCQSRRGSTDTPVVGLAPQPINWDGRCCSAHREGDPQPDRHNGQHCDELAWRVAPPDHGPPSSVVLRNRITGLRRLNARSLPNQQARGRAVGGNLMGRLAACDGYSSTGGGRTSASIAKIRLHQSRAHTRAPSLYFKHFRRSLCAPSSGAGGRSGRRRGPCPRA